MSHVTGTVQSMSPVLTIGPDFGPASTPPNIWTHDFAHAPAPGGTKFLILHFTNASLPANNRLEVDLGYDTDVFTASDGTEFWTRPINIYILPGGLVPIRYITDGAGTGGVRLDKYGRGERHAGEQDPTALSNCDPFLKDLSYTEPKYDPYWYCAEPPNWENVACVPSATDVRARVERSVGMVISVHGDHLSSCSVTLVDTDKVITAGHCMSDPGGDPLPTAMSSSVTFDYQTDCAGNKPMPYNARFYKVQAVLNHRYDGNGDYSLLQLAAAPAGIPAIQIRHDIPGTGEQVFGIHHPNGAVKKLSIPHPGFDTVPSSNPTAINVHLDFDVSGGSSGSGLFDAAGRITGVLSNGNPCGRNSGSPTPLNYFPTSTILKQIATTLPPSVTRDVMVVFDRSGSMSEDDGTGRTKIEAARDAVSLFVQLVRSGVGNRAGLVSFSTAASSPADFNIADVVAASKNTLIGAPPYSGGTVGALTPGGATSIGDGLDKARSQFPTPGPNLRAILLMTDGMENTPPLINMVEGSLTGIDVHAIGFGTESSLNGALLSTLAARHNGLYTRAGSGLALEKFFSHAFGNIFEAGVLMDPEYDLPADQRLGSPQEFHVCGEDTITIVVGWDRTDAVLFVEVTTPAGATITSGLPGVEESTGRTWTFLRIPLPQGGERDGVWSVKVSRPDGGEFPPPAPHLRYFVNVIPTGGPQLLRMPDDRRYYTGDSINPLVLLRYADGSWPMNAKVQATIFRPDAGAGNILSQERLRAPVTLDADTIPARQATLIALERESGQTLVRYTEDTFDLFDDPPNTNGTFEPGGIFGKPLEDHLAMEGNYTFHFRATYGQDCTATREFLWSLHVDVGIDPAHTSVTTTVGGTRPDGSRDVTVVLVPRDRYGNNLGPGRLDGLLVNGATGTTVTGPVQDNSDGSYSVPVAWDPASGHGPGLVIGQPGRPTVVVQEPKQASTEDCRKWKLLFGGVLIVALILLLLILLLLLVLR